VKKRSLIVAGLIALGVLPGFVRAGIVYWDYTSAPVETSAHGDYSDYVYPPDIRFDYNNGANLIFGDGGSLHVYITSQAGLYAEGSLDPGMMGGAMTSMLNLGDTVDASSGWLSTPSYVFRIDSDDAGAGVQTLTGYVGLNYPYGSHYGWAKIEFSGEYTAGSPDAIDISARVLELAYNDTANSAITVGQVPEPASVLMLALGGGLVGLYRRFFCIS
jgi:hypothetical protein